jgi:hypothetical protein
VIKTSAGETRATVQPGQSPAEPRPLATIKSGEKPQIRWLIKNLDPKQAVPNIAVYFVLIKEEAAGAKLPTDAPPRKEAIAESVLGTDLAPKGATSGNYNTALYGPGFYLVEIELLDPEGVRRQYCALDLQITEAK